MKKQYLILSLFLFSACAVKKNSHSAYGTFTDDRDGQVYKTIKIGKQVWMAQNLNLKVDGAQYYGGNAANGKTYGMLYSFYAAQSSTPKGWHVPSEAEWQRLQQICTDPVKTLNIVYGGEFGTGKFLSLGTKATFYTTTHDGMPIITHYIDKGNNSIRTNRQGIGWELSVRCVKDDIAE